jgi:hypothetical protein
MVIFRSDWLAPTWFGLDEVLGGEPAAVPSAIVDAISVGVLPMVRKFEMVSGL